MTEVDAHAMRMSGHPCPALHRILSWSAPGEVELALERSSDDPLHALIGLASDRRPEYSSE